ncbi:hypothetical protein C8R43DRAFT_1121067 [Mycena crocata]|nr:hypothetical protein C8R43DRAFT_1121067 [Mycena crocata]
MATGRKRLKPDIKAEHRRDTLRRYADKNQQKLRDAARVLSEPTSMNPAQPLCVLIEPRLANQRPDTARGIATTYALPTTTYIETQGIEAFDEKRQRPHMSKTQRRHEGRPPPPRPPTLPKKIKNTGHSSQAQVENLKPRTRSPFNKVNDDVDHDDTERDDTNMDPPSPKPPRLVPERVLPSWATSTLRTPDALPPCAETFQSFSLLCPTNLMRDITNKGRARPPAKPQYKGSSSSKLPKKGSASSNPFLVDENGKIVNRLGPERRPVLTRQPAQARLLFCPVTIGVTLTERERVANLRRREAAERANQRIAAQARLAMAVAHEVRFPANPPPPSATHSAPPRRRDGLREDRREPLCDTDLYLTNLRPDFQTPKQAHHKCGICLGTKSHPVLYGCGHGYCYVCTRKLLETSWECPECRAVMTQPPILNYDAKSAIAFDNPDWVDKSRVDVNWDGLTFPSFPRK